MNGRDMVENPNTLSKMMLKNFKHIMLLGLLRSLVVETLDFQIESFRLKTEPGEPNAKLHLLSLENIVHIMFFSENSSSSALMFQTQVY